MRENARRSAVRRLAVVAATSMTAVAALGASAALAATAVPAGSVTVTTGYTQSPVSLGVPDSIAFAITNTTGAAVSQFTFTDTLPAGVTLTNPIVMTNVANGGTCGAATFVNPATGANSAPGDSTVAVTIASVPKLASGTVCTMELGIVPAGPSVSDAPMVDMLSSTFAKPKPVLTPGGLVVMTSPILTVTSPVENQTFKLGQVVKLGFACAPGDALDSIGALYADDTQGNHLLSGDATNTIQPGSHTLTFHCFSAPGSGDVTKTVTYAVKSYALSAVKIDKTTGRVSYKTTVPAGKFVSKLLSGKKVIGTATSNVKTLKSAKITIRPNAAGKALLKAADGKTIKVTLRVTLNPETIVATTSRLTSTSAVVTKALTL